MVDQGSHDREVDVADQGSHDWRVAALDWGSQELEVAILDDLVLMIKSLAILGKFIQNHSRLSDPDRKTPPACQPTKPSAFFWSIQLRSRQISRTFPLVGLITSFN